MIIDTPVHLGLEDPVRPQPIAVECHVCFAIVRREHLVDHMDALHAKTVEVASE